MAVVRLTPVKGSGEKTAKAINQKVIPRNLGRNVTVSDRQDVASQRMLRGCRIRSSCFFNDDISLPSVLIIPSVTVRDWYGG